MSGSHKICDSSQIAVIERKSRDESEKREQRLVADIIQNGESVPVRSIRRGMWYVGLCPSVNSG